MAEKGQSLASFVPRSFVAVSCCWIDRRLDMAAISSLTALSRTHLARTSQTSPPTCSWGSFRLCNMRRGSNINFHPLSRRSTILPGGLAVASSNAFQSFPEWAKQELGDSLHHCTTRKSSDVHAIQSLQRFSPDCVSRGLPP